MASPAQISRTVKMRKAELRAEDAGRKKSGPPQRDAPRTHQQTDRDPRRRCRRLRAASPRTPRHTPARRRSRANSRRPDHGECLQTHARPNSGNRISRQTCRRRSGPDQAIAIAFLEKSREMARMHRHVAAAQNAYYKAMAQLSKLRKNGCSPAVNNLLGLFRTTISGNSNYLQHNIGCPPRAIMNRLHCRPCHGRCPILSGASRVSGCSRAHTRYSSTE